MSPSAAMFLVGITLFLTYLTYKLFLKKEKGSYGKFKEEEARRCFYNYCETKEDWTPRGRIYTNGFAVLEDGGETKFIKQSKLCDLGILD